MKKIITFCLFVGAMLLGSQSIVAQNSTLENKLEINKEASEKTAELRQYLKVNNEQRDQMYDALKAYITTRESFKVHPGTKEEVEKNERVLDEKFQAILNSEQYDRYKAYIAPK